MGESGIRTGRRRRINRATFPMDRHEAPSHDHRIPDRSIPPPPMNTTTKTLADLPGPHGLPLVGNLLDLDLDRLHRVLVGWCDEFGTFFTFKLGSRPVLAIAEPELVQEILKQRPQRYRRLDTIESVFREMGIHGVFSSEGEDWQRQRKLTARALDTAHLRAFYPVLRKVTERLRRRWERAADSGADIEVQDDLMRYTVDVTTNLAFGYDMNTLEREGDIIQQHLERIFPMINRRINAPVPYWHFIRLPSDHALESSLKSIHGIIAGFVDETRARLAKQPELVEHPTNFLEAMLAVRDDEGAAFSDAEVFGNVITLLLAGEDTTANSLAWMIDYLTDLPEVQARLQAEADAHIDASGLTDTAQGLDALDFGEAVAHEAMRLKPVAPLFFLEPNEDVALKGVSVPKGTALMLVTMHPCLKDAHFGEAAQFRPERWLPGADHAGCPHNAKAFVPFGAGPRFCPGRSLALLEIKAVTAMMARCFAVSKAPGRGPVREKFAFTMMPENLFVNFKRRRMA